jgi:phosphate transport system permease protein
VKARSHTKERIIESSIRACAGFTIFVSIAIVAILAFRSFLFFQEVPITDFLFGTQWTPLFSNKHYGIWPLVTGTFLIAFIALSIALPLGAMSAIFLSEFAPSWFRNIFKPALEVLAGIPTIVYGFFALIVVTPMLQTVFPTLAGFNALSPGIVMGLMIVPMMSSLTEDSLHTVPSSLREAAYGLGARKLKVILCVVLPNARPGIVAATILSFARAIGETMIVTVAAGQRSNLTINPFEPVETMSSFIIQVSMGDTARGTIEYQTIFAVGGTLFLLTFGFNLLSRRFIKNRLGVS